MKYYKKTIIEDTNLLNTGISIIKLSKVLNICQPTLNSINNGKYIISEKYYDKLKKKIALYINNNKE